MQKAKSDVGYSSKVFHTNPKAITLKEWNTCLEIKQQHLGDTQFLEVTDTTAKLKQRLLLPEEYETYTFRAMHSGKKDFVIIAGRYKFLIFDINENSIHGPFQCTARGESHDAQSGVLYSFQLSEWGDYLLVYAIDFGLYCYYLEQLSNPTNIEYYKPTNSSCDTSFFFLDRTNLDLYTGIFAHNTLFGKEIHHQIIFQDYQFQHNSKQQLVYQFEDSKYLVLNKHTSSGIKQIAINIETGEMKH